MSLLLAILIVLAPHSAPHHSSSVSPGPPPNVVGELAMHQTFAYLGALRGAETLATYISTLNAADAVREAQEAAQRVPVTVSRPAPTATSGGHSDAWWMGVAQCEQGGRNDPYFGYFSFMDGSQGGRSWSEQVAAGNALLAGQASESPAWAPSCIAAGYAASPGG